MASVGFSYVFPEGINKDRLKFKGRFERELDSKKSLVSNVLQLEKLSSIIYGISFLLFGTLLGVGMLMIIFVLLSIKVGHSFGGDPAWLAFYVILFIVYFILIILLLIDFLTNGLFRRIDWMAAWFYPVAVIFRILTLSFLYRRSLLVLVSNIKGWKSYLIPFMVFVFCVGFVVINDQMEDRKKEKYLKMVRKLIFKMTTMRT